MGNRVVLGSPAKARLAQRSDRLVALLCCLVPLGVYVATLSPTIAGGDSGEIVTVAYLGGVAHPPGYPLYTMAARLFTFLPLGTVAWRVNLLSALCDSLAALLLFRAVRLWTREIAAAVLAAGVFAFSRLIWTFAITAEVFPMNNLFAAGLLYFAARARLERDDRVRYAGAFWAGLGLSHHHTLIFYVVPFTIYLLIRSGRRATSPGFLARVALAFAAGLLPYAYLLVAGARAPAMSWGDTSTWGGLLTHILRSEYGTFQLSVGFGGGGDFWSWFRIFWTTATASTLYVGAPLLLGSLLILRRPGPARDLFLLWLLALLLYLAVFCTLTNVRLDYTLHVYAQERFWQMGYVVVCALMGLGLAEATRRLPRSGALWVRWTVAIGLPAALLTAEAPAATRMSDRFLEDYGEAILSSVGPGGLLVITGDEAVNSVEYARHVGQIRTDVRVVPLAFIRSVWFLRFAALNLPGVEPPSPPGDFRSFVDRNLPKAPIYLCNREAWQIDQLRGAYSIWPMGLVDQVLPIGVELEPEAWVRRAESSLARIDPARVGAFPEGSWERWAAMAYWKKYERLASATVEFAERHPTPAAYRALIRVHESIIARHPEAKPVIWGNLGATYHRLSRTDRSVLEPMVRTWRRYLAMNPAGDPNLPVVRRLLEQAERELSKQPR